MKFRFLSLFLIIIFITFGTISKANADSSSSILVDMVPSNPAPNENTTISLSSYANNLDTVLITWYVNAKKSSSGIGEKSFSLTAPAAGSEADVKAIVSLPDGDLETDVVVRPSVMVLLWQADDSYVPPFYKGKAMPSAESEVKVVAMPEIKIGSSLGDPNTMTYTWQKDYENDPEDSGYDKNFLIYTNDYLDNSNNISVTAQTVDQKYSSQANIDIGETDPEILFYNNDPTLGTIWENALSDPTTIQGTDIVQAAPYFISPKEINNPILVWNWSINNNPVNVVSAFNPNLMPLQTQAGVSGTSKLSLQITNTDKIFETVSKDININF